MLRPMRSPYHMTQAPNIAAMYRGDAQRLAKPSSAPVPKSLSQGGDPQRVSRLKGMCDGILPTLMQQVALENEIGDLRQASGNVVQFRHAMFMLMRLHNMDDGQRTALMTRAMAWYRAKETVDADVDVPWAKSFVRIADAQAGRWE